MASSLNDGALLGDLLAEKLKQDARKLLASMMKTVPLNVLYYCAKHAWNGSNQNPSLSVEVRNVVYYVEVVTAAPSSRTWRFLSWAVGAVAFGYLYNRLKKDDITNKVSQRSGATPFISNALLDQPQMSDMNKGQLKPQASDLMILHSERQHPSAE